MINRFLNSAHMYYVFKSDVLDWGTIIMSSALQVSCLGRKHGKEELGRDNTGGN